MSMFGRIFCMDHLVASGIRGSKIGGFIGTSYCIYGNYKGDLDHPVLNIGLPLCSVIAGGVIGGTYPISIPYGLSCYIAKNLGKNEKMKYYNRT